MRLTDTCLLCEGFGEVTGSDEWGVRPETCPQCEGCGTYGGLAGVAEDEENAKDLEDGRWD